MKRIFLALTMTVMASGCINTGNPIVNGAISGALNSVTSGVTQGAGISNGLPTQTKCRRYNNVRCSVDYGRIEVHTEINKNNTTLVYFPEVKQLGTGGKISSGSRGYGAILYKIDPRGLLINYDQPGSKILGTHMHGRYVIDAGRYYVKSVQSNGTGNLASGEITIQPGVTNKIVVYL